MVGDANVTNVEIKANNDDMAHHQKACLDV